MSWTKLGNDHCYIAQKNTQNVSELDYLLNPIKYENCKGCMSSKGLVGGNNVSKIKGNLVDLENELWNINKELSRCPQARHLPGELHGKRIYKTTCHRKINDSKLHLKNCQFFPYPEIPMPPPMNIFKCPK
jgi:hypothetical protein